jgi:hypothetical protein
MSKASEGLSEEQFRILDCLYFVEPFATLLNETGLPRPIIAAELQTMIAKRWIQVMIYDETVKDYVPTSIHDVDRWDDFFFLATKEGLLKHNGR